MQMLPFIVKDTPETGVSISTEKYIISPTDVVADGNFSELYMLLSCCVSENDNLPSALVVP